MALHAVVVGNVEKCRTEVEVSDESGSVIAVVYQDLDGWHTDILNKEIYQNSSEAPTFVTVAKEQLSHYVNRLGNDPPEGLTIGAFAL